MFIVQHGYGYPVDGISGDTLDLWDDLLDGKSLVTMEIVLPNQQAAWDEAIIDGAVIPLGESSDENWQGFVVPSYVTKGRSLGSLLDITDEDYIELFVDPEKKFEPDKKAVLWTCPVGTECHEINRAKIKAYKLEDDVEFAVPSSLFALEDSLERAYADRRPWLGYMWGPSRLSEKLDLTILKEPEYSDQCWATNKGCAYPTARVLIAVHPSMLTIAPDLVQFLGKWDFTARRLISSEKWMGDNNATVEETAIFFLKTWPSNWTKWVPNDVAQRVQAALAEEMGQSG
jgi:glycine betaine/proline transport system substrate-binding protein